MSGCGAPAFTITPMREKTRSVRLPGCSFPSAISLSIASPAMITMSAASPRARRFGTAVGTAPIEAP